MMAHVTHAVGSDTCRYDGVYVMTEPDTSTTCTSFCFIIVCIALIRLGLVSKHLLDVLSGEGLGPLQRHTQSSVPNELGSNTQSSGNTKENGVVVLLGESVSRQQDTRVGIDVGPGVLGLAGLQQDVGGDLVDLGNELEELVIGNVLESEFSLGSVSGVSLSENGVSVSGNDTSLQGVPAVLLNLLVGGISTDLGLHLLDPPQDFLVGQSVEGTGETVQRSGHGQEGVGKGGTDQVTGVGRDVTSLVVRVDGQVQPHQLDKGGVVTVSEHAGKVGRVVLGGVDGSDLAVTVDVLEDSGSNDGKLGNQVHAVLVLKSK